MLYRSKLISNSSIVSQSSLLFTIVHLIKWYSTSSSFSLVQLEQTHLLWLRYLQQDHNLVCRLVDLKHLGMEKIVGMDLMLGLSIDQPMPSFGIPPILPPCKHYNSKRRGECILLRERDDGERQRNR